MLRVVVLISGEGSNLRSFLDSCANGSIPAAVIGVGADTDVSGLDHARRDGIPVFVEPLEPGVDRDEWGSRLGDKIAEFSPDLVILSGFQRLVPPAFVRRFAPMLLNTHPAFLPEFPGAHAVRDAIEAGATETGATVIVVDDGVDTGPIVAQRRVPIDDRDTESTLHDRIKIVERELLADVVRDIANRETSIEEN
jgi:phosphoribosylglycinamide formyltransferase-1